jgi:hypothetical protein
MSRVSADLDNEAEMVFHFCKRNLLVTLHSGLIATLVQYDSELNFLKTIEEL